MLEMTLEQANELKRIQSQADKVVAHESAHAFVGGALMLGGPVYHMQLHLTDKPTRRRDKAVLI